MEEKSRYYNEMGEGICSLLLQLPEKSHYRSYLIAGLAKYVNNEVLAHFLNEESTFKSRLTYIQNCIRDVSTESNVIINTNYTPNSTKNLSKYNQESIETLTDFFLTNCKPTTNPYGTILNRSVGKKELFSSFKLLPNSQGIGYQCFLRVATELHVVKHKSNEFDLFYCPHCHEVGWNVQKPLLSENPTEEENNILLKYQTTKEHQLKVKIQWQHYHNILQKLDENSLLIVQDYCKKFTQRKKSVVCSLLFLRSLSLLYFSN
jgi:hypothetical protein